MILDTGAFNEGAGLKPADPVRLARALRTLARVLEIARPVLEKAPRWGWVASLAVDVVIDLAKGYAAKLDATGLEPNGHGWRTDEPESPGRYLVTIETHSGFRDVLTAYRGTVAWDVREVIAWQPLPPPFRGDS